MKNTKTNLLFAAVVACMMLTGCSNNKENNNETTTPNVVSFDEVLATRRSVRSYDASKTISEAEVRELLIATQEAPSWANQQPSKYYVAMSPEKIEAVSNLVGERNKQNIAGAPVLIVSTYENIHSIYLEKLHHLFQRTMFGLARFARPVAQRNDRHNRFVFRNVE